MVSGGGLAEGREIRLGALVFIAPSPRGPAYALDVLAVQHRAACLGGPPPSSSSTTRTRTSSDAQEDRHRSTPSTVWPTQEDRHRSMPNLHRLD